MKTILLVFVHGFKGGHDSFAQFPQELETQLQRTSDDTSVQFRSMVYPPYDTKGDFNLAVTKLRDWVQNTVIDLEAEKGTSSPLINQSVKVVLLGHSMGGLVSADVILAMHDQYAPAPLFPGILGLVALDSPMLGLAPGLWTNGVDGLWKKGKSVYDNASNVAAICSGLFASKAMDLKAIQEKAAKQTGGLGWKSIAAISAAGALAAGGALYSQMETIGRGYSWITAHLEFISTLRDTDQLSERTVKVNSIEQVRFSCYYTLLTSKKSILTGGDRTFVVLPKGELLKSRFHAQENSAAEDEVAAHMSMFISAQNSGYDKMRDGIAAEIHTWVSELVFPNGKNQCPTQ